MIKALISPSKYMQGKNVLAEIGEIAGYLGDHFFIIGDPIGMKETKTQMDESFCKRQKRATFCEFKGECSWEEIDRLMKMAKDAGTQVVVAAGGGKTLDTGKAVAEKMGLPVIVVPTIASTDAPCSALSVIYNPDGIFEEYFFLKQNPQIVLVDLQVIAGAPWRFLTAGMGDALATWFETRACIRSGAKGMSGGQATLAAQELSFLCYQTLLGKGTEAKYAAENNVVTKAFEEIVEANILLSGLGFESGGLAAAHAIHNGLTAVSEFHSLYHGEKVAFGTLSQLVLENASREEIESVIRFCRSIGLPTTLGGMGMTKPNLAALKKAAELSCAESETIHNMPFQVQPEDVYAAMITADAIAESSQ